MFNIKPHKEKLDPSLKQMNWEEARKHADQTGAKNLDLINMVSKMVTSIAKLRKIKAT